ncbi:hypothetical protein F5B19DRAFT_476899 [Rostrohypoxylon terebratum]|nr:hypothetical protein F5B19DRAFT_476899 [Rostrohypoxylon terebratum]
MSQQNQQIRDIRDSLRLVDKKLHDSDCISKLNLSHGVVEDIYDRYLLWIGSVEAHYGISLDLRLAAVPEIQHQTYVYLERFENAIKDLARLIENIDLTPGFDIDVVMDDVEENAPNHSVDSQFPPSEEAKIVINTMSLCVKSLLRMSPLIQKACCSAGKHPLQVSEPFELSDEIQKIKKEYPKLSRLGTDWLAERIVAAYARRRHIQDRLDRKAEDKGKHISYDGDTSGVYVHIDIEDAVALSPISKKPTLSKLENLISDSGLVECPICFNILGFGEDSVWREHVFQDIQAYMCTLGEPDCGNPIFGSREAWFNHEVQFHRTKYLCRLCNENSGSKDDVEAHISKAHHEYSLSPKQISTLADAGRVIPAQLEAEECPFCDNWAEELNTNFASEDRASDGSYIQKDSRTLVSSECFQNHVATHQEDLALYYLSTIRERRKGNDSITPIAHSPSSSRRAATYGESEKHGPGPNLDWRWNCCFCAGGGYLSYIYNKSCNECKHRRCNSCEVYIAT